MLGYFDLRKGVKFILDGEPCEVLEFQQIKTAQRRPVAKTKIRNLINGNVLEKTFQQSDSFQEAELVKLEAKYLYFHRDQYFFTEKANPSQRFSLTENQIGSAVKFLKPGEVVEGITFDGKIININLPIKVQLKVTEAPPGVKGDRAQGGTKLATLETSAKINVPLFIEEEDAIEINTETGEYVRRI